MYCHQCELAERSAERTGCMSRGRCGKQASTADLQDLLLYAVQGIAQYSRRARELGAPQPAAAAFIAQALSATLSQANFDDARLLALLREAAQVRDQARIGYEAVARRPEMLDGPASWQPAQDLAGLLAQAQEVGVLASFETAGDDGAGLRSQLINGIKGICAFADQAHRLGHDSEAVQAGIEELLDILADGPTDPTVLLGHALGLGHVGLKALALLDAAHTRCFGVPSPTPVRTDPAQGPAILVSGHDLGVLQAVLAQTRGTGVQVYTHGELLSAHGYPALRAHPHLAGHHGGAWPDQQRDFARFPGPVLVSSHGLSAPTPAYQGRLYTTGAAGWPGVPHLAAPDFGALVEAAQALTDPAVSEPEPARELTVGFGGAGGATALAERLAAAMRRGTIRQILLVGGCDGPGPGRRQYTELATQAPADTVVLTMGCGKYRFNGHAFGEIDGLPRLLDLGQCNDAYSAIRIIQALATARGCDVNALPLTVSLSWHDARMVTVLLTLLALDFRGVRLGPTLPAYLTPKTAALMADRCGLLPIGAPTPRHETPWLRQAA